MAERSLYHTYVRNENGLVGESYVEGNQGLALGVSSSLIDAPVPIREQLWPLHCLLFNATIRIVQHREGTAEGFPITYRVDIVRDKIGYKFIVDPQISMQATLANKPKISSPRL